MNQNLFKRTLHKGFTLVELLIVVIILSILAAIALPQFSAGTDDARLAAVDTTLGNMRAVIDLYYQQHNQEYPGNVAATGGALCIAPGAPPALGAAQSLEAFTAQLTLYTDAQGRACTLGGPNTDFPFGPYLKKADLAPNPITGSNNLDMLWDGVLGMTGDATPETTIPVPGWKYNGGTGQFIADDSTFVDDVALPSWDQL